MNKEEFLKIQTCVLKVNIHCYGCEQKVKKILQKIEGVYTVKIDSDLGKVTVSGNVDPEKLIKKLIKNGKHAEIWGGSKGKNQFQFLEQFKNLQVDNGKGGKNKGGHGQKGGGGDNKTVPNQQMKGLPDLKNFQQFMKDLKAPADNKGQNRKSVKFDLPEEDDDFSDDEFDDDFDDDDDEDMEGDGEFDDDGSDMDDAPLSKAKPGHGQAFGGLKLPPQAHAQNGGGNGKKGGGNGNGNGNGNLPVQMNQGGGKKGGGNGNDAGGKKGNGMSGGPHPMPTMMPLNGGGAMAPMGNMSAVPGLPAGAGMGAYFNGGGGEHGNALYQQQLAAMMMNQQRANGNERFQPMMYTRPPPAVNYMPQYPSYPYAPPPGERVDHFTMFSDENTSSCTVM